MRTCQLDGCEISLEERRSYTKYCCPNHFWKARTTGRTKPYFKDISGKRFGRLVVLEPTDKRKQNNVVWKCLCDCGNYYFVGTSSLNRGKRGTKSCGCLHSDTAREVGKVNGHNSRREFGRSSFLSLLRVYKRNAKTRRISFDLSEEEFTVLTKKNCYYCGEKPNNLYHPKGYNGPYMYNGIDRVDNSVGYILDNCVPCCTICNKMKVKMNVNDFLGQIRKVNKYLLTWEVT